MIALTLLGWGIGGLIGGVLADYLGRKRTMMLAILAYSVMTGLSAFAWDWVSFAVLRFLVGLAIGSEWVTGASIVSEAVAGPGARPRRRPDAERARRRIFPRVVRLAVRERLGPGAWRYVPDRRAAGPGDAVGASGALRSWKRGNKPMKSANPLGQKRSGASLGPQDEALTRFTVADLFVDPEVRHRAIIAFLMSLTTTVAWWGISTWMPPYVASRHQGWVVAADVAELRRDGAQYRRYHRLRRVGFLADGFGRKPIVTIFFAASLVLTPVLYLWTHDLHLLLLATGSMGSSRSGSIHGCRHGCRSCSRPACGRPRWLRVQCPRFVACPDRCSPAG